MHVTAHKAVGDVDTTRLEFSGREGGPIEVDHSIRAERTGGRVTVTPDTIRDRWL
jgi:hypothetical protein